MERTFSRAGSLSSLRSSSCVSKLDTLMQAIHLEIKDIDRVDPVPGLTVRTSQDDSDYSLDCLSLGGLEDSNPIISGPLLKLSNPTTTSHLPSPTTNPSEPPRSFRARPRHFLLTRDGKLFLFKQPTTPFAVPVSYIIPIVASKDPADTKHNDPRVFKVKGNNLHPVTGAVVDASWTLRCASVGECVAWVRAVNSVGSCGQEMLLGRLERRYSEKSSRSASRERKRRSEGREVPGSGAWWVSSGVLESPSGSAGSPGVERMGSVRASRLRDSAGGVLLQRVLSLRRVGGGEDSLESSPMSEILSSPLASAEVYSPMDSELSLSIFGAEEEVSVAGVSSAPEAIEMGLEGEVDKENRTSLKRNSTQKTKDWLKWLVGKKDAKAREDF
ncbi:hypothetical protein HDU98_004600 [Podochytrium sp. JEL0797]|nr:hypothetical protein HDU98_004600 [Podochytrium sp. JEL0797]